jgi:fatty acid-binding protein DegV
MNKVMIVTDSTATIPHELLNGNPITSVPLQVIWGNEILRDDIDIKPKDFYERLVVDKVMPSTSQVTPEEFKLMYGKLIDEGYDILSVHISSKLSGTLDSATQAKQYFPEERIQLVDSLSTSMAMGFQVLSAARMAASGGTLAECKAVLDQARENAGIYFVVNTLEFLHRGGRIEGVERVRRLAKAIYRLLDLVEAKVSNGTGPIRLCAVHANAPKEGEVLLEKAVKRFPTSLIADAAISTVSPVLGTHIGPGALGMAYMHSM